MADGNLRDARAWYGGALVALVGLPAGAPGPRELRRALLANRCLAHVRGGRHEEALRDARELQVCGSRWCGGDMVCGACGASASLAVD